MNPKTKFLSALLCCCALPPVGAVDFDDYARVINVAPQVEQINRPRQECRTEQMDRQSRNTGGSIIGGVAGAILGNQVGGGNGRIAATAAGAITGAIVGDRMENGDSPTTYGQSSRHCRTVDHWESRNNGYAVTYDYHGHRYTNVMPYDPGERLRINVSIVPRIQ